jgi:hypothetical protein
MLVGTVEVLIVVTVVLDMLLLVVSKARLFIAIFEESAVPPAFVEALPVRAIAVAEPALVIVIVLSVVDVIIALLAASVAEASSIVTVAVAVLLLLVGMGELLAAANMVGGLHGLSPAKLMLLDFFML